MSHKHMPKQKHTIENDLPVKLLELLGLQPEN